MQCALARSCTYSLCLGYRHTACRPIMLYAYSLLSEGDKVGFGLVYWGLTPQQQPGSYQGGEMMMTPVFLAEETGVGLPRGNHAPTYIRQIKLEVIHNHI